MRKRKKTLLGQGCHLLNTLWRLSGLPRILQLWREWSFLFSVCGSPWVRFSDRITAWVCLMVTHSLLVCICGAVGSSESLCTLRSGKCPCLPPASGWGHIYLPCETLPSIAFLFRIIPAFFPKTKNSQSPGWGFFQLAFEIQRSS